jgi:hypothetical protein
VHRPREWDSVVLIHAGGAPGPVVRFVALRDGSNLVEESGDTVTVEAIVAALDSEPPYRAEAVRRDATTWAVGIRAIHVVELPPSVLGDELELVWDGRERSTRVGGVPTLASVYELEALASARFETWVVRASRLRDTSWEVEIGPL